ncbi:glycosyl hydrolase family 18 protein [Paenibacillus daejeonensis]|uniref:glycosyl hydrolase family 18 protein n=1 Tax=Paenibacillus daejeonensis TaxID=135193 RepID=UPI00037A81FC|nr:glycosyl hydrolase family 18 protein [Paenibacillus daejeonensis]
METVRLQHRHRRRGRGTTWLLLICIAGIVLTGGYFGWYYYIPNPERIVPDYNVEHPIVYEGEVLDYGAVMEGGSAKLPIRAVAQVMGSDEPIHYEAESGSVIMTTSDKVLHLQTGSLAGTVNLEPYEVAFAADEQDGELYIPITPLQELYGLQTYYHEVSGVVTLVTAGQSVQHAEAARESEIRSGPSIREPVLEQLLTGQEVRIWASEEGWFKVQGSTGHTGYIPEGDVRLTTIEQVPVPERGEPFVPWDKEERINLTWEAVYSRNPDTTAIGQMPGVNVVSPTWFELVDGTGQISSKADPGYVAWARNRGYQVWALFSNSFDPDLTTEALATYESRLTMIQQLISYARTYQLQGINIDFENVYTEDKENLIQFVRELTPLLHKHEQVVSIDVTPKSNSEMWSAFLDREALARSVDYMMLMAYDEHWASSPVAGSVASLPWVEHSVRRLLEEDRVPPHKLILGIPLYTRIWTEQQGEDGQVQVSSRAIGMETADQLLAERGLQPILDEATGQHYVEYEEDGARKRIWLEDGTSARARMALVRKYDLGGIASWQRGFQKPQIWEVLHQELQRP